MSWTSSQLRCFTGAFCLLLAADQLASAQDVKKARLRLDFSAVGYHAPFFLGVEKGYYREKGIDLEVLEGKGSANSASLVGTGADTFAFADATTTARLVAQGLPVKVVLGVFQKSTLALFFAASSPIQTPANLKNKKISMCAADGMAQYVPIYLDAAKVPVADVQFVTVDCGAKYVVVAQGQADAVASYSTAGKQLMNAVGIKDTRSFEYFDAGIVLPSHGIVASLKTISEDPKLIERFNAATVKTWEAAKKDPDAAVAALVAALPLQKGRETVTRENLVNSFAYMATPGTAGKVFGWQSPDEWEQARAVLVKYLNVPNTLTPDRFYTNAFVAP